MDRFDRIIELNRILSARRTGVSRKQLQEEMEASRETVKRAIRFLRDQLHAPLEYDRKRGGYFYDHKGERPFELPGMWFNSDELFALLTTHHLLSSIQPGLLDEYISPFITRIEALLPRLVKDDPTLDWQQLASRVEIQAAATRPTDVTHFRRIVSALTRRRQIRVLYHGRERDQTTERVLSPQKLRYYRDNWYLDAWCHMRDDLRRFSLDRLYVVATLDEPAREHDNQTSPPAYGIFAAAPLHEAHLRFTPEAARWVADEQWHEQQQLHVLPSGECELRVPYGDARELMHQILWYGPDVEVLSPPELRIAIAKTLSKATKQYER